MILFRTVSYPSVFFSFFFFFNDTATTEIYTLSLHDALPISTHLFRGAALLILGLVAGSVCLAQSSPSSEIGRAHVELQSHSDLVCRLLLEKKKKKQKETIKHNNK